jgi:hypothetical protein
VELTMRSLVSSRNCAGNQPRQTSTTGGHVNKQTRHQRRPSCKAAGGWRPGMDRRRNVSPTLKWITSSMLSDACRMLHLAC